MRAFFNHALGLDEEEAASPPGSSPASPDGDDSDAPPPPPKRTPQPGQVGTLHAAPSLATRIERKSTFELQVASDRKARKSRSLSGSPMSGESPAAVDAAAPPPSVRDRRFSFTDMRGNPFEDASIHAVETKHSSKVMATFLEDHGKSEAAYAKSMKALSKQHSHDLPPQDRGTTLDAAWTIFKSGWEREAAERRDFGLALRKEASDLHAWRHKQMKTKKIIIAEGAAMTKKLKAAEHKYEATKRAYMVARDRAVATITERNEAFRVQAAGDGQGKVLMYAAKIEAKLGEVQAAKESHYAACQKLREMQLVYRSKMLSLLSSFEALDVMRVQRTTGLFQTLAARERAATLREADLLRAVETTVNHVKPTSDVHMFVSRQLMVMGGNAVRQCDALDVSSTAPKTPVAQVPIAARDVFFEPYISALPELNEQLKAAMQMEAAGYGNEFLSARSYGVAKPPALPALPPLTAEGEEPPPLPPAPGHRKTPRVPPRKTRTKRKKKTKQPTIAPEDFEFRIINVRKVPVRLGGAVDDAIDRAEAQRKAPRTPSKAAGGGAAHEVAEVAKVATKDSNAAGNPEGEARASTGSESASKSLPKGKSKEKGKGKKTVKGKGKPQAPPRSKSSPQAPPRSTRPKSMDIKADAAAADALDADADLDDLLSSPQGLAADSVPPAFDAEDEADAEAHCYGEDDEVGVEYALVVAAFEATCDVEITITIGERIALTTSAEGSDWWSGTVVATGPQSDDADGGVGASGEFPATFVERQWVGYANYDYAAEEEGDLAVVEGERLVCCSAGPGKDEWLDAFNDAGERGLVPLSYVEANRSV